MVLKSLAYLVRLDAYIDVVLLKLFAVSDPTPHQDAGCRDRPCTEDDAFVCKYLIRSVLIPYFHTDDSITLVDKSVDSGSLDLDSVICQRWCEKLGWVPASSRTVKSQVGPGSTVMRRTHCFEKAIC